MTEAIRIQAWARSDKGRVRTINQDSFLLDMSLGLFVVADGMGGGLHGEIASKVTCNVLREYVSASKGIVDRHARSQTSENADAVEKILSEAVSKANEETYNAAAAFGGPKGRMGSTLDAVLISGTTAFIAHVGDSRVWIVRDQIETMVTKDHTLVQERIDRGVITKEQADNSPQRSIITRAIGVAPNVNIDRHRLELRLGDKLVLSSDGLYRYMSEGELAKWAGATNGAATVDTLVTLANNRGGRDNITVLVLTALRLADATAPLTASKDLEVLRRCDLFSTCTQAELKAIGAVCRVRDLPPNAVIFSEGDPGWECYIIARGEVSITKNGSPLADLTTGDHFGERSLVDTPSRGAAAKTKGPVKLFVLTRRDFEGLMRENSILATRIMWRLSAHLARMVRATTKVLINRRQ